MSNTGMEIYQGFADMYDALMKDVDYDAWADYLLRFMKPGDTIADCACGTGQLSIRFAKAGHNVTGIDISERMLFVAQQKARKAGLRIPFVQQDMQKLALHKPVDVVNAACDGVNYLASDEEAQAFFHSAFAALKPGGLLMFDVSSRYKLEAILGNNTYGLDDGDMAYLWLNAYDDESHLIRMDLTLFQKQGELYKKHVETHIQRAYEQNELTNMMQSAGFYDINVYGEFSTEQPSPECERLQYIARRPER